MLRVDMAATLRQNFGKGAARTLRRAGMTPAVLYGQGNESVSLSLETRGFTKQLVKIHGQNVVVALDVEGDGVNQKRHVMLKEVQKNPVTDLPIHADFYEISLEQPMTLPVSLRLHGQAKGVDLGGVLNVARHEVHLKGLPLDIPDWIEADITSLELGGKGLICGDLAIPENVELLDEAETVCVSVIHPKRAEASVSGGEEGAERAAAVGAAPVEGAESAGAAGA